MAYHVATTFPSRFCRPLLSALLVAMPMLGQATVEAAPSMPETALAAAARQDTEAVERYVHSGERIPRWASEPGVRAALAQEAVAQGLPDAADPRLTEGLPPEEQTLLAALQLARVLAQGAVSPGLLESDWTIPTPRFEAETALRRLGALDDPLPWLRSLAPQIRDYRGLRQALATYYALAMRGGWPMIGPGPTLKLGMSGERVAMLRTHLKTEGDLAAHAAADPVFDAAMAMAVRRFQSRHGLAEDGRVGRDTLAALNVSAWQRYRQIAANLERWRWLARAFPPNRIVINAAAARLVLFQEGRPVLRLRAIVGTPLHPTPALTARIRSLLLNPPWDIPADIAAHEIRPLARRDPGYLVREQIINVAGGRLRQLPGPLNALGRIKFEMPNPLDIYVHDTPTRALFAQRRRFFSHGCIRVQNPEQLALRLLHADPAWTPVALEQAVSAGETRRIRIEPSVPVFVVYFTAGIGAGGEVEFRDDAYDRDPALIAALFPQTVASVAAPDERLVSGCRS
jgi:L,D-transpeptidase YcbB